MLNSYNIDLSDHMEKTTYPFDTGCSLILNGYTIPSDAFGTIRVNCDERTKPPIRMSMVKLVDSGLRLCEAVFTDTTNRVIARLCMNAARSGAPSEMVTTFLTNVHGLLAGTATYKADVLPYLIFNAVNYNTSQSNVVYTDKDDFILSPECMVATMSCHVGVIRVGDRLIYDNLDIRGDVGVHSNGDVDSWELGVAGPIDPQDSGGTLNNQNGYCRLAVEVINSINGTFAGNGAALSRDPVWIGGKHLIIRSSPESNLRVVNTDTGIQLKGVTDA